MNKNNKSDNDKCRLCLRKCDKRNLTSVFTNEDTLEMSLASKIMICLSLPVDARDSFPNSVCKSCEHRIVQFHAFREDCLKAYYSLLKHCTTAYSNEEGKCCEKDSILKNNVTTPYTKKICKDRAESSDCEQHLAENTHENYVVCIDRDPAENCTEKMLLSATNLDSNFEEISSHEQVTHKLQDEIVPVRYSEIDISSHKNSLNPSDGTNKGLAEENKVPEEDSIVDESAEIVKYKCLHCSNLFSNLYEASIHFAQCAQAINNGFLESVIETEAEYLADWQEKKKIHDEVGEPQTLKLANCSGNKGANLKIQSRLDNLANEKNSKVSPTKSTPVVTKRRMGQIQFRNIHDNPRYRCEICRKPFLRSSDIKKHMTTHTCEKPYDCDVYSKSFARLSALQQHAEYKPYVCEFCGEKFAQKTCKTKHVKIHKEGAKPHTYSICSKTFSNLEQMNLHQAGHGGGKPRKCSYCDKSFQKPFELSRHMTRWHIFENPHTCSFCQKVFFSRHNLKQHVMTHTGQKPYACSSCDFRFTQKSTLKRHYERKHADRTNNQANNYCVVEIEDDYDQSEEVEILTSTNDLLKNSNDPLSIEREKTGN